MSDYIDKLLMPDDSDATFTPEKTPARMVVGKRALSSDELEACEAVYLASLHLPAPFVAGNSLEPLTSDDIATLEALGITPEEWEIALIENFLANQQWGIEL